MPPIKLQHVVSCSSEDPNHKADNLLKDETYRKWKCKSAGEKNVSVILQFEKSTQIHSIDIGNDGSAFAEVLVGKSTFVFDFSKVILVSSSFMSPAESKNCNNVNRVRIFGSDKLSKTVCNQNWDRVKIVCTQPFNKHTAFGLSFIKFHSPPLPGEEKSPAQATTTTLGAFKIRSDSPQKITPGLFFKTAKEKKETEPIKDAAAVRAAPTVAASTETTASSTSKSPLPSTQSKRKLSQDEVKPSMSKKRSITPPKERKPEVKAPPLKKTKSEPTKASTGKEFSQLMKGVVFALSGFQNPKRGNIRDKALDMGAKYKSDWCNECTHLICAFANTPKYNQVKKKGGKIVSEKWIFDCYKRKMRLPWKSYRIGDAPSDEESEEESEEMDDDEEDDWVPTPKKTTPKKVQTKTTPKQKPVTAQKKENTPKKLSPKAAPKPGRMNKIYLNFLYNIYYYKFSTNNKIYHKKLYFFLCWVNCS
ncbi:DNA repair protein XRCC1-like [Saccoglossus kowalevskii]